MSNLILNKILFKRNVNKNLVIGITIPKVRIQPVATGCIDFPNFQLESAMYFSLFKQSPFLQIQNALNTYITH